MPKTVSYNDIRPKIKSYKKAKGKGYRTLYFKKNLFVKPFEYSPNNIEKWIVNDTKMVNMLKFPKNALLQLLLL